MLIPNLDLPSLIEQEERAFKQLNLLWYEVQTSYSLERPSSSSLLLRIGYMQSVLRKIRSILIRFCEQFEVTTSLAEAVELQRSTGHTGFSQQATDHSKVTEYMVLDFEFVFQLAANLLDQWTAIVRQIAGIGDGKSPGFNNFATKMKTQHGSSALVQKLHHEFSYELTWLYANILLVRNKFIAHSDSQWQRGVLKYPNDLSLGISLAPDWAGTEVINGYESRINRLAVDTLAGPTSNLTSETLIQYSSNPRFIFSHMMWCFGEFDEAEQAELAAIAMGFGFTTPPFKLLVASFLFFIEESVAVLRAYAVEHRGNITLGLAGGETFPFQFPLE